MGEFEPPKLLLPVSYMLPATYIVFQNDLQYGFFI
eukprot:SAG11_NODE_18460_length_490_cov_1.186701_1_plen_34_part_01